MRKRLVAMTFVIAAALPPSAEAVPCANSVRTADGNRAFAVAPNGRSYIYGVKVAGATCSRLRRAIGVTLAAMPHKQGRITYGVWRFRCRGFLQEGTPSGVLFGNVRCVRAKRRFRFSYTD